MGFYNAKEKARFKRKWDELRKEYQKAGMSDKVIQEIYEFDLRVFRADRIYAEHTQEIPSEVIGDDSSENSTLLQKFESSCTTTDEDSYFGRYFWIETVESPHLAKALKCLSTSDLELLTLICIEGYSQSTLARKWNCSQSAISQKICRIKKLLR